MIYNWLWFRQAWQPHLRRHRWNQFTFDLRCGR